MKNGKFYGMETLMIMLALCFILSNCDTGTTSGYSPSGTAGELIIHGLDVYDEQYVVAACNSFSSEKSLLAATGFNEDYTTFDAVKVSNGKATLKVWEYKNSAAVSYNDNDDILFDVFIYDHTPVAYEYGFSQYSSRELVYVTFSNGGASGEIFVPSVQANLSDPRFNGVFKRNKMNNDTIWSFDGTNKAVYTSYDYDFTREVKLENGRLWSRLWDNQFSAWGDGGAYSFSEDGTILTIGYDTFTLID